MTVGKKRGDMQRVKKKSTGYIIRLKRGDEVEINAVEPLSSS